MQLHTIRDWAPPALWRFARKIAGRTDPAVFRYQGVQIDHDMSAMHEGAFDAAFQHAASFDPVDSMDRVRLRVYFAAFFAKQAAAAEGDFFFGGVSYGLAPRVIYELVPPTNGRRLHLVDPFEGVDLSGGKRPTYNTDPNVVRQQYPPDAPIVIHRAYIPHALPLPGVGSYAFVHLNTGVPSAEADSLHALYSLMSPGAALLIDAYANVGFTARKHFDPVLRDLGASAFVLPTGQGVVIKDA